MSNLLGHARLLGLLLVAAVVAGCTSKDAVQTAGSPVADPAEGFNRSIHSFNVGVDRVFFRPASKGYVAIAPDPVIDGFSNFAENLSYPGQTLDFLLQGNLREAGIAAGRFALNTTFGLAGFFDPSSEMNIPRVDTDFGETLHVWGFGEGAYLELPFYGPSTTRDAIGVVANAFTTPLRFTPTRAVDNIGVWAEVIRRAGDRGRFSETIDSILYGSADSYAQARLIYIQNRRFQLAQGNDDAYLDLYSDPYADAAENGTDPYSDAYSDPYEDPYAE